MKTFDSRRPLIIQGIPLILLALMACSRDEVRHYRTPKEVAAPPMPMQAAPPPQMPTAPAPTQATSGGGLSWKLPQGWTQEQAGGMRFATLKTGVAGRIDVSVVTLPGPAGGELANVNRWRSQIGLPPIDEASMQTQRTALKSPAGPVSLYDFTSEGQAASRTIAGLITTSDGNTWFFKMTGDVQPVGKAKPGLLRLLETLRLD